MERKEPLRTQVLTLRVTPEEHDLLQKRAHDENMTLSEYVRYAVLLDSFFSGNTKAYKIISKGFSVKFQEKMSEWFSTRVKELKQGV